MEQKTNVLAAQRTKNIDAAVETGAISQQWGSVFAEGRRIAAQGSFTESDIMPEIKKHRSKK